MSETNPTGHIKISKLETLTEIKNSDKLIIPVSNDTGDNGTPKWGSYSVSASVLSKYMGNNIGLTVKTELIGKGTDTSSYNTIYGARKYTDEAVSNIVGNMPDLSSAPTIWGAKNYAFEVAKDVEDKLPGVMSESGSGISVKQTTDGTGKVTYTVSKAPGSFFLCGNKTTISELPSTDNIKGDVWSVGPADATGSSLYSWDGDEWIKMGGANGTIDIDTTASSGVALAKNTDGTIKVNVTTGLIDERSSSVVTGGTVYMAIDSAKTELMGNRDDAPEAETIYAAKNYADYVSAIAADAVKTELIGDSSDSYTANTICGAKNFVDTKFIKINEAVLNSKVGDELSFTKSLTPAQASESIKSTPIMYVSSYNPSTGGYSSYTMIWRDYFYTSSDLSYTFSFAFFNGTSIVKKVLKFSEGAGNFWMVTE